VACSARSAVGLGPSSPTWRSPTAILVTERFGSQLVGERQVGDLGPSPTALRALQATFGADPGGGASGVRAVGGRPGAWSYYVNGLGAEVPAGAYRLSAGDQVWWDRHPVAPAGPSARIPAVVGQFPEPFVSGAGGRRRPVRIDCAEDSQAACRAVGRALSALGVKVSQADLGAAAGLELLRLVVGPWTEARMDPAVAQIGRGPGASGVFARPSADGRSIAVLDPRGRVARVLRAGAGLVAATRYDDQQPVWAVTGTDAAGVAAASRALRRELLRCAFALALDRGRPVRAPLTRGR
jgi:hypothetical protein